MKIQPDGQQHEENEDKQNRSFEELPCRTRCPKGLVQATFEDGAEHRPQQSRNHGHPGAPQSHAAKAKCQREVAVVQIVVGGVDTRKCEDENACSETPRPPGLLRALTGTS